MTIREPPRTGFVARYGLVRYAGYLGDRYPRDGVCELGVCRARRADAIQRDLWRRREGIPRQLQARHALDYRRAGVAGVTTATGK